MTTGYEANYYRQFDVLVQTMRSIDGHLNRLANCAEAGEKRAREPGATPNLAQMGAVMQMAQEQDEELHYTLHAAAQIILDGEPDEPDVDDLWRLYKHLQRLASQ